MHAHLRPRDVVLLVAAPLLLAACVETSRPPDQPDWKRPRAASLDLSDASLLAYPGQPSAGRYADPFWSTCYQGFQLTADPVSDLDRLGLSCGTPRGYSSVAPIHTATQKAEDPAERLVFRARKGRCYRLFAIGDGGIRDLDVAILGPDGRVVAADLSKDSWSVVPPRGPWCADEEGPFAIDVSVAQGEGAYALGVWGSEPEPRIE